MNKILTSVLGLLTATASGLPLQGAEHAPRLVIGIHIDQLDANYLEWFRSGFGADGFKKLLQSGTQCTNMVYASAKPDNATAAASFMTGATPREHGITAANWFDPSTGKTHSCVLDPEYLGNYTQETVSPKHLLGSTLVDELKKASNNEAHVYAVGIDADKTVLLGGHSANGVFWLDEKTGNWCTSTYFNYMPAWLQGFNDTDELGTLMHETDWTPLKALSYYQNMPHQAGSTLFKYELNKPNAGKIKRFKQSPLVNEAVVRIASELLEREQLGKDEVTDYLLVQLSAANGLDNKTASAMQIQDIYYRLDQDIAKLLLTMEKVAGKDVYVYLTGAGQSKMPVLEQPTTPTYTGDFYPQRCTSLLNLYLMALYGNEPWVSTWYDQKIYLNRKRIEEKGIDLSELRKKAASFLAEFTGVTQVYTYDQLLLETTNKNLEPLVLAMRPEMAADLYLELQGGWNVREVDETNQYQVDKTYFTTPFLLYKPEGKAQVLTERVAVGDVTASLSRIFRIRPPNDCKGIALPILE